jgi:hypothetical protein
MVAELLYLEKQGTSLPIEMLINSSGTTRQDGEIVSKKFTWKAAAGSTVHEGQCSCKATTQQQQQQQLGAYVGSVHLMQ